MDTESLALAQHRVRLLVLNAALDAARHGSDGASGLVSALHELEELLYATGPSAVERMSVINERLLKQVA